MAFSKDLEFKSLPVTAAHISIYEGNFQLSKESIIFSVAFRAVEGSEPFNYASYECRYDINGANPFDQAYLFLKGLPEFAGATDC